MADSTSSSGSVPSTPALEALAASGLDYEVTRHGRVGSLAEAAEARGVSPAEVVKTMVVRRGADDHLLVLVPGDRAISWPKLRELLGVNRLSMPDADAAFEVTGYRRGTITPFGTKRPLPVVADVRVRGHRVSIGAGDHGVAATLDGDALLAHLRAEVADVTDPEQPR
ncbi:aminoacyl-tRNA deacylase [Ruicaihuangia caeni]|uniref:YbaK/EbsC family protein n=1 Tax=Ruicaihuangia caeni TaxID=3042517 RepID=A0AAW6T691_9MICO|nr:YbaK/EbsC family protein [Klugiella sp. YN-L-19]MDI2099014.1 YbaK/EbsC family protein [Klugiella sp. YN-L-19]